MAFRLEEYNLWRRVLVAKFGANLGGWRTDRFHGPPMGAAFGELLCWGGMYFPNMLSSWLVWGVGFWFWHDLWCGEHTLKDKFPLSLHVLHIGRLPLTLCW
jgi:hypothetical protein